MKIKRERGSPCLRPLYALTHLLVFPFTKIANVTEDKHLLIPPSWTKPFSFKHMVQKISINLIIGFFKINFEDYIHQLDHRPFQNLNLDLVFSYTSSLAIRIASRIYFPSTKAPWVKNMVSWRTLCNHPDRTLAMILYKLVTKLMGL